MMNQYYPLRGWSFIRGEIIKIDDRIEVDFGDIVKSFCKDDIFYAIETMAGEEAFVTTSVGRIEADYRKTVLGKPNEAFIECRRGGTLRSSR